MTTRPKQLAIAVAAAMSGIAHLPAAMLAKLQDEMTVASTQTGFTHSPSQRTSSRTVAQDKRDARRKRNRARARRRFT
jgi:hypothetical protein